MVKYEYKKVKGRDQKKFTENGHTMFEDDVLQRLKRLAYLEEKLKQANEVQSSNEREKLINFLTEIKKDKDSITIKQQVDTYLLNN